MSRALTEAEMDAEANYFAICLLMPRDLVNAEFDRLVSRGHGDSEVIANTMARQFGVSNVVMTMRLLELGHFRMPL